MRHQTEAAQAASVFSPRRYAFVCIPRFLFPADMSIADAAESAGRGVRFGIRVGSILRTAAQIPGHVLWKIYAVDDRCRVAGDAFGDLM